MGSKRGVEWALKLKIAIVVVGRKERILGEAMMKRGCKCTRTRGEGRNKIETGKLGNFGRFGLLSIWVKRSMGPSYLLQNGSPVRSNCFLRGCGFCLYFIYFLSNLLTTLQWVEFTEVLLKNLIKLKAL